MALIGIGAVLDHDHLVPLGVEPLLVGGRQGPQYAGRLSTHVVYNHDDRQVGGAKAHGPDEGSPAGTGTSRTHAGPRFAVAFLLGPRNGSRPIPSDRRRDAVPPSVVLDRSGHSRSPRLHHEEAAAGQAGVQELENLFDVDVHADRGSEVEERELCCRDVAGRGPGVALEETDPPRE
jgi:hypothetical protein